MAVEVCRQTKCRCHARSIGSVFEGRWRGQELRSSPGLARCCGTQGRERSRRSPAASSGFWMPVAKARTFAPKPNLPESMTDAVIGRKLQSTLLGRQHHLLGDQHRRTAPRFIPQREFDAIPQSELVVDHSQVVLHDVLGRPDSFRYFLVLQTFGHELDDEVFTLTWDTGAITSICRHACLRYNRVASLTRLIPPVMPKRRKSRLKWAFTVRRAMLS